MTQRNYDASMLTYLLNSRVSANFQRRQQYVTNTSNPTQNYPQINPQTSNYDASTVATAAAGSYTTYSKRAGITVVSVPCSCTDVPPGITSFPEAFVDPPIPIDTSVLYAFESILTFGAAQNYSPTLMSRFLYVWFASIVNAWNWVQATPQLSGVHDDWDWDIQNSLDYDDSTTWMILAINAIMPSFVSASYYDYTYLLGRNKQCHGWTDVDLAGATTRIQAAGNWTAWSSAWTTWLANRATDGSATWKTPTPPPNPPTAFPNASTYLNTNDTVDPATFPVPTGWTPLWINAAFVGGIWTGGTKQKYATYNWDAVTSTCLTAADETALSGLAAPFFPDASERQAELADIVAKTAALTDLEKVTAEWWAGGPYTVTPPGIFMWFWKNYMTTYGIATNQGIRTFMLSGLQATVGLFEAGRVIWGQKLAYVQARPIQDIRRLYRGQTLVGYDGLSVLGESWMPYQEPNFVTPPFPDFTSGHSAYSSVFANTMAQWFGDTIRTDGTVALTDIQLITPDLSGTQQTQPFGSVVFPSGSSLVQPTVVPAAPTTVAFTTWSSMAESAGLSRQYGGIHAQSAHLGSLAIINGTNGLYEKVKNYWNFY